MQQAWLNSACQILPHQPEENGHDPCVLRDEFELDGLEKKACEVHALKRDVAEMGFSCT